MKGIVFTNLNEMVEENYGIAFWDQLLEKVDLPSGGIYTAAENYDAVELYALLDELSKQTDLPVPDLVVAFGEYLLGQFAKNYPHFFHNLDAKAFLKQVDEVVHVEVEKLYKDAGLPTFTYEDPSDNELVMIYQSPRKLCHLAKGLISGTAKHYGIEISNHETQCLLKGDDCCRFELIFK